MAGLQMILKKKIQCNSGLNETEEKCAFIHLLTCCCMDCIPDEMTTCSKSIFPDATGYVKVNPICVRHTYHMLQLRTVGFIHLCINARILYDSCAISSALKAKCHQNEFKRTAFGMHAQRIHILRVPWSALSSNHRTESAQSAIESN